MFRRMRFFTDRLKDDRSRKVVFVSHCLLNENTRYLGGAFRKGCVGEVLDELDGRGLGVVQMECPEQMAWGGVLKRYMWLGLGIRNRLLLKLKGPILALFVWRTKRVCRRMARKTVRRMKDYSKSGFEIVGVIGIDGSPSCGVRTTVDIGGFADRIIATDLERLDREAVNDGVRGCLEEGRGLFIKALLEASRRSGLELAFYGHDLVKEMDGVEAGSIFEEYGAD